MHRGHDRDDEATRINERERIRRYIEQAQLTATMNTTKWCELTEAMLAMTDVSPRHRIKDILGPEPPPAAWDGEWFYHLRPYERIEWLEVECFPLCEGVPVPETQRAACRKRIAHILHAHTIPFSMQNGVIRIWGYLRPGFTPTWEERTRT